VENEQESIRYGFDRDDGGWQRFAFMGRFGKTNA